MKIAILGAAGFIGTNLALRLVKEESNQLLLVDKKIEYFEKSPVANKENVKVLESEFGMGTDFSDMLQGVDVAYHLFSTINPASSNCDIGKELQENVSVTINILDACVKNNVKMIVFLSSGGTVYGEQECPVKEEAETNPINTYGIQKLSIEKVIYLYNYLYELDYRIIRLANPYGPYQRPDGKLGAVTTFSYKAVKKEKIYVYGDGMTVRDYIYIDDAIEAVINICTKESRYKVYNVGSGVGHSLLEVLEIIEKVTNNKLDICFTQKRQADLQVNYLDVSRYEKEFGKLSKVPLLEGISKTVNFFKV